MNKIKHSKVKNVGIMYELLARKLTADVLNDNTKSKAVSIFKEFFGKDTEISKELELYNILQNKKTKNQAMATDLLNVVLETRQKLSNSKLRKEKYNLVKRVNESFDSKEFFNARIPNYKFYASVYNLFEEVSSDKILNPVAKVNSKFTLIETISTSPKKKPVQENEVFSEFSKSDTDVRLLAYKTLVDKFNKKYSKLTTEQKEVLKKYIYNVSDNEELKTFVNDKLDIIEAKLEKHVNKVNDEITRIKLHGAINKIQEIKNTKHVSEKTLTSVLRYYDLVTELGKVNEKK
tara:strand:- start:4756 stop:5628 length:873 start_codon:yes stop_codon:yes gene_type:complete